MAVELHSLPFERPSVVDPAPLLEELRSRGPITRVRTPAGDQAWLVTDYGHVMTLLNDERLGRSHPDPENAPRYGSAAFMGGPLMNSETEKAEQAQMRRLVTRSFMVKRMNALRPAIQAVTDDLLDRMAALTPPADLHTEFSMPLPALVICELLGVPIEDRDRFREWTTDMASMYDMARVENAYRQLYTYMYELVARKRHQRGEDVISDLLKAADEGEPVTDERIALLAGGLLFGGFESTMSRLDLGTVLLLTHPDQRELLERDPSLVVGLADEVVRRTVSGQGVLLRYANTEVVVGSETIEPGELVLLAIAAANFDPGTFAEPERFDIERRPNHHVGFGHGSHFCLGAGLARIELQVGLGTLFRRFPSLALAVPMSELRPRSESATGGITALPVTW
jgi:pentalenolactone synthase